jgi:hypothetical protein
MVLRLSLKNIFPLVIQNTSSSSLLEWSSVIGHLCCSRPTSSVAYQSAQCFTNTTRFFFFGSSSNVSGLTMCRDAHWPSQGAFQVNGACLVYSSGDYASNFHCDIAEQDRHLCFCVEIYDVAIQRDRRLSCRGAKIVLDSKCNLGRTRAICWP